MKVKVSELKIRPDWSGSHLPEFDGKLWLDGNFAGMFFSEGRDAKNLLLLGNVSSHYELIEWREKNVAEAKLWKKLGGIKPGLKSEILDLVRTAYRQKKHNQLQKIMKNLGPSMDRHIVYGFPYNRYARFELPKPFLEMSTNPRHYPSLAHSIRYKLLPIMRKDDMIFNTLPPFVLRLANLKETQYAWDQVALEKELKKKSKGLGR
ncbi:hypothetical protein [Olivibacter jilunii]|uniref:hypothetical protein n=1 Tax=Olivibacter jilunii TaxID=985016 RepID=UPI00102FE77F|nr:hypothetical protein [Olivibacter jilunii]